MLSLEGILFILCLSGAGLMLVLAFTGATSEKDELPSVQQRLAELTQSAMQDNEPTAPQSTREKQLQLSFNQRVVFPLATAVFELSQGLIPLSNKSWVKSKLSQAGYTKPQYPKLFLGLQLLCSAVLFGGLFFLTAFMGQNSGTLGWVLASMFGFAGYALPFAWLLQQVQRRQLDIQKSLPDFIDLLVICVEAGLGLDLAIQKICALKSVKTSNFLREELGKYLRDIGFGRPRRKALQELSQRVGLDDLTTLVNALIQSYEMGTGVATTLRVQSEMLRNKRVQRAEEKANKIPVKMIIPIYIFLFPAIFVAMGGPLAVMMIKAVSKMFSGMEGLS